MIVSSYSDPPTAGLLRRLLAIVYDAVLLLAVLYCAGWLLLPFGDIPPAVMRAYALAVAFLFYGWFWMRGGQTLGLRTWRLQLVTVDDRPLTWGVAMLRFSLGFVTCAFFGAGLLWMLFDREGLTMYDRFSGTRVVLLPKKPPAND